MVVKSLVYSAANGHCSCYVCILWVSLCMYTYIYICTYRQVRLEIRRHLGRRERNAQWAEQPEQSGTTLERTLAYYKCNLKSWAKGAWPLMQSRLSRGTVTSWLIMPFYTYAVLRGHKALNLGKTPLLRLLKPQFPSNTGCFAKETK